MDNFFLQFRDNIRNMPVSKKIILGATIFFVVAGFGSIFLWANNDEFKRVYSNLAQEDVIAIAEILKKQKIQFKLGHDETSILVAEKKISEVRLLLASEGQPRGGGVGFEIFDKTDFGTTEFVQKLNYQRALQGELARTIKDLEQVKDAKVLIVMPKDSVFVEDTKPPSASVFLKLRGSMPPAKVRAIVHLVASSIEDLTPELVTVVDSKGRVLSSGTPGDDNTEINSQLKYKLAYEKNVAGRIQTMLEGIVGIGKAIVRVTADIDFSRIDVNEELYDPDAQVIRSRQTIADTIQKKNDTENKISSVNPIGNGSNPGRKSEKNEHQDDTINYEISKTIRVTQMPVGVVKRLSVAAVLDGSYVWEEVDGGRKKVFSPRTEDEIKQFTTIVRQTMGYSADREDQVTVQSIPFSVGGVWAEGGDGTFESDSIDWESYKNEYGRAIANVFAIFLIFLFVVRPLIRNFKQMNEEDAEEAGLLPEHGGGQFAIDDTGQPILPKPKSATIQDKAMLLAREDITKAANIIKGWLTDKGE